MPFLVSRRTADWLRSAMGRGAGFGSRQRRIACSHGVSRPSVVPACVESFSAGVYTVGLYANGVLSGRTGRAQLVLPEVSMLSSLERGTFVLAHLVDVIEEASGVEEDEESGGGA